MRIITPLHQLLEIPPIHKAAMDHFEPLPETANDYKYIIVNIGTFTKYVEIYPYICHTLKRKTLLLYSKLKA